MLLCLRLQAQMSTQGGTTITVDAGTSLRINDAITWTIASGAQVVNNGDITFGPQAQLSEALGSPITGAGTERTTRMLNGPLVSVDPAGFGLRITTSNSLGNTLLVRGHAPITDYSGHTSIARWYRATPAVNSGLNGTVDFGYDPVELNGVIEAQQVLHIHEHDAVWHFINGSVNTAQHLVSATALDSLGWFTTFDGDLPTAITSPADPGQLWLGPNIGEAITLHVPYGIRITSLDMIDASGAVVRSSYNADIGENRVMSIIDLAPGAYRLRINNNTSLPFIRP